VTRAGDGTISSSVVNAGVLPHPVTGASVVGMVVPRRHEEARQLARPSLRETSSSGPAGNGRRPRGRVDLIGPDDPAPGFDAERLRLLLREIFTAAGGTHEDFDTYDRGNARGAPHRRFSSTRTASTPTPASSARRRYFNGGNSSPHRP